MIKDIYEWSHDLRSLASGFSWQLSVLFRPLNLFGPVRMGSEKNIQRQAAAI